MRQVEIIKISPLSMYLHLIYDILQFEISGLMNLIFSLPYARHYNPRFVYFLHTFGSPNWNVFQWAFFIKFWSYLWLVFKSGLQWRAYGMYFYLVCILVVLNNLVIMMVILYLILTYVPVLKSLDIVRRPQTFLKSLTQ